MIPTRVKSSGLELAVVEYGDRARPTVVLVHGYPDSKEVWSEVAPRLAEHFHVIVYDVRGAGESAAPTHPAGYHLDRLRDDFLAVIDALAPGKRVHLVGHDWGSIQGWHVAIDVRASDRLLSFTSISGPCLDHVGHWLRRARSSSLAMQALRSWYVYALHVPGLPRVAWRTVLAHALERSPRDGENGAHLYRRNVAPRLLHPRPDPIARVPVQLIVPTRDPYLSPDLYEGLERWVPSLTRTNVEAEHWVIRTHPDLVARLVTEFADGVSGGAIAATRSSVSDLGPFADRLVIVTGAGSGIGRATALSFAEKGARLIAIDIDHAGVERTVELARLMGRDAHAFTTDVSDAHAMEKLADEVTARFGAPDVVVNNAGIGIAGPFLETTADEFRRTLDVNLGGVAHGCRLFGRRMVEAKKKGHIVNVASAAAFLPSKALPVYATSKAAVLMLSECLRAELAPHGIGVTAVCPGVVATNITRTTRFAGTSDRDEIRLRTGAVRTYARRDFSPTRVADEIVAAVLEDEAVVPVTLEAKVLDLLGRFAPRAVRSRLAGLDLLPR